ncbi:MAG: rhomboid family intramembrane serine protease [Rikenellaceae bacterium]
MEERKIEKITSIFIGAVILIISLLGTYEAHSFGIYPQCSLLGRMSYSFFHANMIHAALNVWCLLSIVFIRNVSIWRLLLSYLIACSVPIEFINSLVGGCSAPTVGLSGVVFALFASISFNVVKKFEYQAWMAFYILIGFLSPSVNAWLHLYCYIAGFILALINKPITISD